ncbi:MAG: rRNA maturation RNase YbeY [Pseudomonadota bacterium]
MEKIHNNILQSNDCSTQYEIIITRQDGDWSRSISGYKAKIKLWCEAAINNVLQSSQKLPPTPTLPLEGIVKDNWDKKLLEISIVLADDKFIKQLNYQFRGKNKATNVLSFPSDHHTGDIILSFETIKKEAKKQKKSFAFHTAHLVIHGTLHLLGFDHEKEKDAVLMEAKEILIMKELGFSNPYN